MSRWNITDLVFYSKHGEVRTIEFNKGVTIITGGSNTGKSAVIDSIDYCLGSSSSRIASFITDRVTHIGCKWKNKESEFFVARAVAKGGGASSHMYIDFGTEIEIPKGNYDLKGAGNKDSVKSVLEHLFGITEDIPDGASTNKISVRYITPFIFLDKEVIDSRNTLMHHLDDKNFSKGFVESLPFFLGAIDKQELEAIKLQNGLLKGIEIEEKKKLQSESFQSEVMEDGYKLFREAQQFRLLPESVWPKTKENLIEILKNLAIKEPQGILEEDSSVLKDLEDNKIAILERINALKNARSSAVRTEGTTTNFEKVINNQYAKLDVLKFFRHAAENCPVCDNQIEIVSEQSTRIYEAMTILQKEHVIVKQHKPKVSKYIKNLEEQITEEQDEFKKIDVSIRNLIKESEIMRTQFNLFQQAARVIGRISYFLDNQKENDLFNTEKLDKYNKELGEISELYGKSRREEKIELAQRKISEYATENLKDLPKGYPCEGASINFFSKIPKIIITDNEQKSLDFANIGSDENYLSIHMAFAFAFQKFLGKRKAAVPGVLILDQVSRPYYSNSEDQDVQNVTNYKDDDQIALEKHFDFIFKMVEDDKDLQVIVLEHAYLSNNEKFAAATKYIWPKSGNEKLIPSDWPKSV